MGARRYAFINENVAVLHVASGSLNVFECSHEFSLLQASVIEREDVALPRVASFFHQEALKAGGGGRGYTGLPG